MSSEEQRYPGVQIRTVELMGTPIVFFGRQRKEEVVISQKIWAQPCHFCKGRLSVSYRIVCRPDVRIQHQSGGNSAAYRIRLEAPHRGGVKRNPAGEPRSLTL